nr:MAG TPA: hypothetical protein [Bacteriophage sp.]
MRFFIIQNKAPSALTLRAFLFQLSVQEGTNLNE